MAGDRQLALKPCPDAGRAEARAFGAEAGGSGAAPGPRTLNLGILAHVDAGKTTLTERLLQTAGVVETAGSVDEGTTQTDSMELERQRGITIRAAAVSFTLDGVTVNIIDTPGHPDFIAEVERSLTVLDGAVLVVSAVEGVQAQTIVLFRALKRLGVPTLIFVNKIDRSGADPDRVIGKIRQRLSRDVIVMARAEGLGGKQASVTAYDLDEPEFLERVVEQLVEHDDELLGTVVRRPSSVTAFVARERLREQVAAGLVHLVYLGAAAVGVGLAEVAAALIDLLPSSAADPDAAQSGLVFKVDRGRGGEKIAYARMFGGSLRVRERVALSGGEAAKVTRIEVLERGEAVARSSVGPGQIARLHGLRNARIGDVIGTTPQRLSQSVFAPPILETAVVASDPADKSRLHAALSRLAEQDPLINLHQDDRRQEMYVSLYGEVQKEVLQQTLANDFGIDIEFRETTTICREVPRGVGSAVDRLREGDNPFMATIGLTVAPGPKGSGITFIQESESGSRPLYVFKTFEAFDAAMTDYVSAPLQQGLYGWQVTDCAVTMTECGYFAPASTAGDYRKLAPLVVMEALRRAGTTVCEPVHEFRVEAPAESRAAVLRLLAPLRASMQQVEMVGAQTVIEGVVPAAEVHRLQGRLVSATQGEGVLEAHFSDYIPVVGEPRTRPRFGDDPLNRQDYLRRVV